MFHQIVIPDTLYNALTTHLFQNSLEQGAFLLAKSEMTDSKLSMWVAELISVMPNGWDVQSEYFLEMSDSERARIMKIARDGGWSLIECHSHPGAGSQVQLSPSDHYGLKDFVRYVKWKLDNRPYCALVFGEHSFDGRIWYSDFETAHRMQQILVTGDKITKLSPVKPDNRRGNIYGSTGKRTVR